MAESAAVPTPAPVAVPLWAWALVAFALVTLYLLLQENGTLLTAAQATWVHEVTHDARHALGVPCH
ncbi:MAG: CbtB-domain containing protein [Nocardioidaceae bacterium]|nr:CbtB-domain containing protein [Nocardioidaceae bacterium]NUS52722.1 CbtB-domain containing protein [Nocardioidaceae bacterium]